MASTKTTRKTTKPIRIGDGPTEFFPKRGSGKRSPATIPMIAGKAKATSTKPAKPTSDRGLSGLDAAAKVLAESRKALTCQEIVTAMLKRGLWKTEGRRLRPRSTPPCTARSKPRDEPAGSGRPAGASSSSPRERSER